MAEFATKADVKEIKDLVVNQNKTIQELIVVVAKQGQASELFFINQARVDKDLKDFVKDKVEATFGRLDAVEKNHTERLNKHSEDLKTNTKEISKVNTKVEVSKNENKNQSRNISLMVGLIFGIISSGATVLWNVFTKGGN